MINIIKCKSGFYAVMYWDTERNDFTCYYSGSKNISDALNKAAECNSIYFHNSADILYII